MVTITIEKIIQGTGNMVRPMFASVIGATVNIILDPILIFGYFGMPKMGVTGAAIATIIGQAVSASINLISIFKKNNDLKISFFSKEAFDIETIKEKVIYNGNGGKTGDGLSSLMQSVAFADGSEVWLA